jgi:hypothetical protein
MAMQEILRQALALVLSGLLVLTGQGVAASRGVGAAVGQVDLCTGSGPVMVHVDAEGQPTHAPHFCPDRALALLGAVLSAPPHLSPPPGRVSPRPGIRSSEQIIPVVSTPSARAPPLV